MQMRTTILAASLSASIFSSSYAQVGVGEYRYGPDTSESFACLVAEERAKEDLIVKTIGERIEAVTEQRCKNEDCKTELQTFRSIDGEIASIKDKKVEQSTELGARVCRVTIDGSVKENRSTVTLTILTPLDFKHNDQFFINVVSNFGGGELLVFNFHNDKYTKIYQGRVTGAYHDNRIPNKGTFKAVLPLDEVQSREKLLFVHVLDIISVKSEYSIVEMRAFLSSISTQRRGISSRFITVRR